MIIAGISAVMISKNYYKELNNMLVADAGLCKIQSALESEGVVSVEGKTAEAGANIILDAMASDKYQTFKYFKNENGTYSFELLDTGIMLDVVAGGQEPMTNVQVWTENGQTPQNWYVIDWENGYVSFMCECNGLVLDVEDAGRIGSNVHVYDMHGGPSQLFQLVPPYEDMELAVIKDFENIGGGNVINYVMLFVAIILLACPYERLILKYKERTI